jgi:hypothetical protein
MRALVESAMKNESLIQKRSFNQFFAFTKMHYLCKVHGEIQLKIPKK